jgi:hypothetical protein
VDGFLKGVSIGRTAASCHIQQLWMERLTGVSPGNKPRIMKIF